MYNCFLNLFFVLLSVVLCDDLARPSVTGQETVITASVSLDPSYGFIRNDSEFLSRYKCKLSAV